MLLGLVSKYVYHLRTTRGTNERLHLGVHTRKGPQGQEGSYLSGSISG